MPTTTERLYYHDAYLQRFEAQVIDAVDNKVYLDRTAFYPSSGGQPFDRGTLGGIAVEDVIDEGDRVAHVLSAGAPLGSVTGEIDWTRRFDHMQQHSGQHLLSAVLVELFDIPTVSFHLGAESSTIDVTAPSLSPQQIDRVSERVMQIVFENRSIEVLFGHSSEDLGLRKASEREGVLRIISITDLDRSACGGTHVRSTAEIGPVLIRKLDKIRGNVRIEFICGMRAVRRARADYNALSAIARTFSAPQDDTPALVEAQMERVAELDKSRKKMAAELAAYQGRELYQSIEPDVDGIRRITVHEAITDDLRSRATSFASQPKAVFIAASENPPSILMAASKDSGVNAGERVKNAVTSNGGRGGGSPTMAQGSLPNTEALQRAVSALS
jgi:alanyl-tRNA synthetase